MSIQTHIFNSIQEFYEAITSEAAEKRSAERKHPNSSKSFDSSFSQTNTLTEALDLLRNGVSDKKYDLTPTVPTHSVLSKPRSVQTSSPIGYAPHVPNALRNLPNSMISSKPSPTATRPLPRKSIIIVRDVSYHAGWDAEDIRKTNLKTTEYIRSLMLTPTPPRITLYAHIGVDLHTDIHHIFVRIKAPDQRLIVPNLNFALCHPSFLRRCYMRWAETSYDVPTVPGGYGSPIQEPHPELLNFTNQEVQWIRASESVPAKK